MVKRIFPVLLTVLFPQGNTHSCGQKQPVAEGERRLQTTGIQMYISPYIVFLVYCIIGPSLGGLALFLPIFGMPLVNLFDVKFLALLFAYSFLYGILPALCTGIVHVAIQKKYNPLVRIVAITAAGLAFSAFGLYVMSSVTPTIDFYLVGGVSALLIGLVIEGIQYCRSCAVSSLLSKCL